MIAGEFSVVLRPDIVAAAKEAAEAGCGALIARAFAYNADCVDFDNHGIIKVLKARMNNELHMATDLKNTGKGNLFVIFGEPDIEILKRDNDQIAARINGIDTFKPSTNEVISSNPDSIALWMIDADYNEESFCVRHAYFLGANDPYSALKRTLKNEIDEAARDSLHSAVSRPFDPPKSGRIAVKAINHLGDEAMKIITI
ncbi:MAG: hypothetical protein LBO72_04405 [Helicobacteraceae bacterium]|jgi:adenine-specific DNA-methyltransferase|nr:hypothetical protein [Helicobacteraceae bacterium]